MGRSDIITMLAVVLPLAAALAADSADPAPVVDDSASSLLTDARCAEVKVSNASEITCFLSFPDTVPNFFYETDSTTNRIIIKLLDTKTGGMTKSGKVDSVNLGPITTLTVHEEIQDKNATVRLLTPEWYYVTMVTLACNPMVRRQNDLVVAQDKNVIAISFPWPEKPSDRKKYYILAKKQRRPAVLISLIGIAVAGIAGGGYCAYHYYYLPSQEEASRPLEPVLPEHPSP